MLAPVRICCGKRHLSVDCPDGHVMCCLCFDRFPVSDLNFAENGGFEQVIVIHAQGDQYAEEMAQRIINSVELTKTTD